MNPSSYKTLIELFASDLDKSVVAHLSEVWKLHGNPFIAPSQDEADYRKCLYFHCQAVVKE